MQDADRTREAGAAGNSGKTPPAGLVIRPARPFDAEPLATLTGMPKYRAGTLRLPYETPESWRQRIESCPPGDLLLLAELAGKVVGSAGLHGFPGRRVHAAEIGMGVRDDMHGRGIGRALLSALVDSADNWLGLRRLELTVFTDNEAAIRLYRSFGFETEGTLRGYAFRDGAFADVLAMARFSPRLVR